MRKIVMALLIAVGAVSSMQAGAAARLGRRVCSCISAMKLPRVIGAGSIFGTLLTQGQPLPVYLGATEYADLKETIHVDESVVGEQGAQFKVEAISLGLIHKCSFNEREACFSRFYLPFSLMRKKIQAAGGADDEAWENSLKMYGNNMHFSDQEIDQFAKTVGYMRFNSRYPTVINRSSSLYRVNHDPFHPCMNSCIYKRISEDAPRTHYQLERLKRYAADRLTIPQGIIVSEEFLLQESDWAQEQAIAPQSCLNATIVLVEKGITEDTILSAIARAGQVLKNEVEERDSAHDVHVLPELEQDFQRSLTALRKCIGEAVTSSDPGELRSLERHPMPKIYAPSAAGKTWCVDGMQTTIRAKQKQS